MRKLFARLSAQLFTLCAGLLLGLAAQAAQTTATQVEIKTSQGTVVAELYGDKAPRTVENFLKYSKDGFYNGTIFHRVINGFMIQGGGFVPGMKEKKTRAPIRNEAQRAMSAGLRNEAGTLAMARTQDPHSAAAQFFINLADNRNLDYPSFDGWGYAVFGKVVSGMDVIQKIAQVPTGNAGMHQNVPLTPVVIESITVLSAKESK
ncbi:peptidyl-prolyl cis-trans isomerase A [Denitratisoma sp. DHT3]|uniref:peptidylprolyl isomerase n=1 Tax=Denitratisoma sp. DHT3 TaxID=1981880 RepID=UPI0011982B42|nr:peptidylprolyl isomerase [Denitratisoma sp. DHT3]QDX80676.1 peptidyl-prolyl cis-trans isomerase A [Denitratisoma sp. DHT3]